MAYSYVSMYMCQCCVHVCACNGPIGPYNLAYNLNTLSQIRPVAYLEPQYLSTC